MAASPNVFEVPSGASPDPALQPEGFAIRLPSAQLADLIQINCFNRVRGAFRVSSGPHQGHLFFEPGRLIHADFGEVIGLDAVVVMLGWRGGSIEPCLRPWPNERSIDMGADALLLHAAQRLDELPIRASGLEDATTKVVRRVQWPAGASIDAGVEPSGELSSEARPSYCELRAAVGGALSEVQVAHVAVDGTIQRLKAGATTELADTAFFCHRVAAMIGQTLGLGECRALSVEATREGIVVFKGKSIVGARGKSEDLDFIRERVGLK
jgi:hypothetical protein